jgi:4-amino-4-deoxy-L-arabinose transferase-like glycosyltransferase
MSHAASPSAWGSTDTAEVPVPESEPYAFAAPPPWSRRERLLLSGIVLLAASMYGWEAAHVGFHGFYAVAVRSMTTGWRAFLFGALDPNASITIDKIPGFLWPQALSADVFGFHPWSLALPQAVEGVVTVCALHAAVRRWAGPTAALLAAGIFALTPVAASLFGKGLEDAALTCLLVLAAAAWQRAVLTGRLRWLLLCGFWVGLAFQAKMLQSWAVLPAFGLAYLIAAPPRLRTRIWQTLSAAALCVLVSMSWVIIATLTPAADRPYVDGSTDNSAVAMVFGYNGLARFGSVGVSAAGTGSVAATQGAHFGSSGTSGWLKLFEHNLASQVGWLYPVAAAGILLGLWRRGRGRTDRIRSGALMWTGWLLTTGLALSAGSVPHSTYVVALAPPLAALSAYALVRTVQMYRRSESRAQRLALPALTAVTLGWAARLSAAFPAFVPGIALPLVALAVTAVVVTVIARWVAGGGASRVPKWTAAVCCALMLAVPAVWSLSVFDSKYAGSSGNANAGGYQGGFHFPHTTTANAARAAGPGGGRAGAVGGLGGANARTAGARMFNPFNPPTTLDPAQSRLMSYLVQHRDGARYLLATESWAAASPYILADTASVLPMGGFSGAADFPQPQQFSAMVQSGEVHYVLLTGRGMHFMGMSPTGTTSTGTTPTGTTPTAPGTRNAPNSAADLSPAAAGAAAAVPGHRPALSAAAGLGNAASAAGTAASAASAATAATGIGNTAAGFGGAGTTSTDLTDIANQVTKTCQLVPASAYGAVPQETGPLYHCG